MNCNRFSLFRPLLAVPLTHWLMNLPCVTLHDSCHSSNLAHSSASGERKRGARSIDVNYADVTREGAHRSVSPPKESIKVKQLVFSPLFFFFFQRFNNVTMAMDNASASPDK